jgi:predicted enzyme related to lactoylglutathione lyase
MAHGELNHVDIPADDVERAKRFYSGVFGWSFQEMPGFPDYFLYRSGPGEIGGGLGKRGVTAPQGLRPYAIVDDIDASTAKATELGGRVTVPKTEVPGQGWYAAVQDTEGSEFGLWQNPAA